MPLVSLYPALLLVPLLWLYVLVRNKHEEQPSRVEMLDPLGLCGIPLSFFTGLQYLWKGPDILHRAHVKDIPYAIHTPEGCQIQFSSREHIKQLLRVPDTHLSLHALAKDPEYTMNGLRIGDSMIANGTVYQRALQVEIRWHLPALTQPLVDCIARSLAEEIVSRKPLPGDWHELKVFPMAKRLITATNALVFFGPTLSRDPVFLKAALEYPEHLVETAEALRLLPPWLAPFAAPILMRRHRALKIMIARLAPVVETRLNDTSTTTSTSKSNDCIQFFIDAIVRKNQNHKWPTQRIIQVLLGIWFASVHQPAMCLFYALDDLCLHREHATTVRNEVRAATNVQDIATLPFLNGFLKESARLNPTDSITFRRKVLRPFALCGGTARAKDDLVCIPLRPILQDPASYGNPDTFNPHRFLNGNNTNLSATVLETKTRNGNRNPSPTPTPTPAPGSDFTDADLSFPIWGLGKQACPGRFYAFLLLKLVLAQIVLGYEVRMPDGVARAERRFYWRSAIVPRADAVLHFRRRL